MHLGVVVELGLALYISNRTSLEPKVKVLCSGSLVRFIPWLLPVLLRYACLVSFLVKWLLSLLNLRQSLSYLVIVFLGL